ncbi:MAG: AAA family ATPase [Pseudomonadota bacterium]
MPSRDAPGAIIIVSGAPAVGKTTVSALLASDEDADPQAPIAVHLRTDAFHEFVARGYIAPWLPESYAQNTTISRAIVAAATAYARGGWDVYADGVVGPWFLPPFRTACERHGIDLHYVVLRPDDALTVERAAARREQPLPDYPRTMLSAFADLGELESHVLDSSALNPAATAARIRERLARGELRLPVD